AAALSGPVTAADAATGTAAVRKLVEAVEGAVAVVFLFEFLVALRRCRVHFQFEIIASICLCVRCAKRFLGLVGQIAERSVGFFFASAATATAAFVVIFLFGNF